MSCTGGYRWEHIIFIDTTPDRYAYWILLETIMRSPKRSSNEIQKLEFLIIRPIIFENLPKPFFYLRISLFWIELGICFQVIQIYIGGTSKPES